MIRERIAAIRIFNYRRCFLIYVLVFVALVSQVLDGSRVVSPLRQTHFGIESHETFPQTEDSKFSDFVMYAVPESTVFLQGKRSGWLVTWTPYTELGRPTSHLSGLSPAYLPNWILSKIFNDAFRYVSAIAILTMFASGAFAFLLARELNLHPASSLIAALAVGVSPALIYWVTFPMFAAAYGWTSAILYAMARFARRRDMFSWSMIAFGTYSILMTAYPVMIIYHAYICAGLLVYLLGKYQGRPYNLQAAKLFVLGSTAAAIVGCLAALPALVDTLHNAQQSARSHPDTEFLRAALQPLQTGWDWIRYVTLWTFPQLLGNPLSHAFPSQYIGRSLAPFALYLVCAAGWRRTWGWWLYLCALLAMESIPSVFDFAIHYLGIGVSRSVPMVHAILPLAMIAATNLDTILSDGGARVATRNGPKLLASFAPAAMYLIFLLLAVRATDVFGVAVDRRVLVSAIIYLPVLVVGTRYRIPSLIVVVAVVHLFLFDRHLLLTQPRQSIVQSTPATRELERSIRNGGRYAVLPSATDFMLPNMNAQILLSSVHTYDSLSPLRYQAFVRRLGAEVYTHGRLNVSIGETALGSLPFNLANIHALVTREAINSPLVALNGTYDGLYVYRVLDQWGRFVRVNLQSIVVRERDAEILDTPSIERDSATVVNDLGDRIDLVVRRCDMTTMMIASQAFNADWHAEGRFTDGWHPLTTMPVDDAFEGVVVPPGVTSIHLRFTPWVRWSWLGHCVFLILAVVLVLRSILGRSGDLGWLGPLRCKFIPTRQRVQDSGRL